MLRPHRAELGGSALYEAYKPGTEPGKNRDLGLRGVPGEEKIPVASAPNGTGQAAPVPASSTGGLY